MLAKNVTVGANQLSFKPYICFLHMSVTWGKTDKHWSENDRSNILSHLLLSLPLESARVIFFIYYAFFSLNYFYLFFFNSLRIRYFSLLLLRTSQLGLIIFKKPKSIWLLKHISYFPHYIPGKKQSKTTSVPLFFPFTTASSWLPAAMFTAIRLLPSSSEC